MQPILTADNVRAFNRETRYMYFLTNLRGPEEYRVVCRRCGRIWELREPQATFTGGSIWNDYIFPSVHTCPSCGLVEKNVFGGMATVGGVGAYNTIINTHASAAAYDHPAKYIVFNETCRHPNGKILYRRQLIECVEYNGKDTDTLPRLFEVYGEMQIEYL